MAFEELNSAFVFFCGGATAERAEILSPAGLASFFLEYNRYSPDFSLRIMEASGGSRLKTFREPA